jgi:hypothetical protein
MTHYINIENILCQKPLALWPSLAKIGFTGPTQAYEGSHYKYIEVSSPTSNNDKATLVSTTSLTGNILSLQYYYLVLNPKIKNSQKLAISNPKKSLKIPK